MKHAIKPLVKQQGVAIVTALLLASLAITLVMNLFQQQNVQIRSIENQRLQLQKQWVLRGAIDWARLILREDAKLNRADYLGEPWSVPLKDTKLDQYVEKGRTSDDQNNATLSGHIVDATSRLNLTNLAPDGVVDPATLAAFQKLLSAQGIDQGLATAVAQLVASTRTRKAQLNPDGSIKSETVPAKLLSLTQVDDLLAVPGFTPADIKKLEELVVFLPVATPININTASAQVISARIPGLSLSDAQQIVTTRDQAYFRNLTDLRSRWTNSKAPLPPPNLVNTQSNYFIIHGKVKIDRSSLDADTLIERKPVTGLTRIVWIREM
jgi:general secretion pathway protein K